MKNSIKLDILPSDDIRVEMRETVHSYVYIFTPAISEYKIPQEVKDLVARELYPRGGGFKRIHPLDLGFGSLGMEQIQAGAPQISELEVPKTTPIMTVQVLFGMMRQAHFDIGITTEIFKDDLQNNEIKNYRKYIHYLLKNIPNLNTIDNLKNSTKTFHNKEINKQLKFRKNDENSERK